MEKEVQFILIDTGSESNQINMSDVGKMDNGIQISATHRHVNKLVDFLIKVHFSYAITCKVDLPGKYIWHKYCVLNDFIVDDNKEYYVIVVNNAIHRLSVKYLNELSKRQNVHLVSLLLDAFHKLPEQICHMIQNTQFEKIYSFQKSDCEKYGFDYTNQIYSKVDLSQYQDGMNASDVYFIGAEKGRIKEIYDIYLYLKDHGLNCDFNVVVSKKKKPDYDEKYPGICFITRRIGYTEILEKISGTRCILELCQEGQDGLTMRFYEAMFYNKLLITNNVTAKSHASFHPNYMQVINKAEDIDVNMLVKKEAVDYKYSNQYSPVLFAQQIVRDCK